MHNDTIFAALIRSSFFRDKFDSVLGKYYKKNHCSRCYSSIFEFFLNPALKELLCNCLCELQSNNYVFNGERNRPQKLSNKFSKVFRAEH